MESGWNYPNKVGVRTFMIGALIGYLLFMAAFIQDTEAIVFSAMVSGDDTLRTVRCPELITRGETGVIEVTVTNHSDKRLYRYVRTYVSEGYLTLKREINSSFYQDPGESTNLEWEVSADDAAWGYLIMAKVLVFKQTPLPSYVGTCAITSLDIPYVRGWHLIAVAAAASVILMGIGYRQYVLANRPLVRKKLTLANNLRVIAISVTVAMGMSLLFYELWYAELALFIFTTILMAESTFQFSQN
ncbi:MAG: hypothetical protein ACK2T7_01495 [Anaerolineales bacterium]